MVELNEIDRVSNNRPGGTVTTREPARLDTEYPIEYLIVLEEETDSSHQLVDYHYHFEDEGNILRLVESYKLVGQEDERGCTKHQLDGTIEQERAIDHIQRHWAGRWDKVVDGEGNVVVQTQSDY